MLTVLYRLKVALDVVKELGAILRDGTNSVDFIKVQVDRPAPKEKPLPCELGLYVSFGSN
jgi:hypothetical protein